MEGRRPNCVRCRYFQVTWDAAFPKGCKAYGFKSRELPSAAVFRSSGAECQLFDEKRPSDRRAAAPAGEEEENPQG